MKRREILTVPLAGMWPLASLRAAATRAETMEAAAEIIQRQVDAGVLESAVLRVQRGRDVFERAFGRARPADAVFLLASITKPMTATAVMVLADRGELELADKVVKFIPEFADGSRKEITIQHLLTHTSGLPDQLPENSELRRRHAPLPDFVSAAVRTPLLFEPGTKYSYQSMGILLAAEVVQRIARTPLPEFLSREVFAPLGMKHSALGLGGFKIADTVRCQTEHAAPESGGGAAEARDWDWNSGWWRSLGAPWGGAHGSAEDVTRFLRSFLHPDGSVLREDTARLMIRDHTKGLGSRRGIGFALGPEGFGKACSPRSFGHGGATGTLAWADPESDLSCVILTSLPTQMSGNLVLRPVSDVVSSSV